MRAARHCSGKFRCGVQAEKELSEVTVQLESLHERLEEADGLSSAQVANSSSYSVFIQLLFLRF